MASVIETSAPALKSFRARWVSVLLALGGAGMFLYAGFQPTVDSPRACCPRLIVSPGIEARTLTDSIAFLIPLVALAAAVRLIVAPPGGSSIARGVLFSTGLVGAALIVRVAGALIDVKGGTPATGALLGFTGASLIVAAAVLWPERGHIQEDDGRPKRTLRLMVPLGILLGAGMFVAAVMMPWSNRPHPMRLVWLNTGPYWNWSALLPAAIILPTFVAALRLLLTNRRRPTEIGVALGGGIFATLLFGQVVGMVLSSSFPEGIDRPPVFALTTWAYLGLGAGGLILASALVGSLSPRR